jgi:hypothetical protein
MRPRGCRKCCFAPAATQPAETCAPSLFAVDRRRRFAFRVTLDRLFRGLYRLALAAIGNLLPFRLVAISLRHFFAFAFDATGDFLYGFLRFFGSLSNAANGRESERHDRQNEKE